MLDFIGRKKELEILRNVYKRPTASLVVIQGRRRIGKSRLAVEFAKDKAFFSFVGLPPGAGITAQSQRDEFARVLGRYFEIPGLVATDWADLFTVLAKNSRKDSAVILIDEISWMANGDPTFLGKLKNAWDLEFKNNNNLMLILCGSVSPWIEKNILLNTGFVGRVSQTLMVGELALSDCNKFWGTYAKQVSAYEKFKYLSIVGGVPYYLEIMDPSISAENNMSQLAFKSGGVLVNEFERIFTDLFGRRSETYEKIVRLLAKGSKEMSVIADTLKLPKNGWLSEVLDNLVSAGFVTKDYTWHILGGKESKLNKFRLNDNYLRFYLKYIEKQKNKIENNRLSITSVSELEGWDTISGLQFENLVVSNRRALHRALCIAEQDIVSDNPFFQKKTKLMDGCQIDFMVQVKFNTLYVCEIKFSKNKIGESVVDEVQKKIDRLKHPKGFSVRPILVHVNGVTENLIDRRYFADIIDFTKLLES